MARRSGPSAFAFLFWKGREPRMRNKAVAPSGAGDGVRPPKLTGCRCPLPCAPECTRVARPRVSGGAWEPERRRPCVPGEPDSVHPKPATADCASGVPPPPGPSCSAAASYPHLIGFLLLPGQPLSPRGPTALRCQSQLMGGGASKPTAHALGAAREGRGGARFSPIGQ